MDYNGERCGGGGVVVQNGIGMRRMEREIQAGRGKSAEGECRSGSEETADENSERDAQQGMKSGAPNGERHR